MYDDKIMQRFVRPLYVGEFEDADAVAEVGNMKCGDIMKIFLKIKDNKIEDIRFKTYGCVTAIVSTDFLCEIVKGMPLDEAKKITPKDVIARMGDVPPVKIHCSVLAYKALSEAIKNYQTANPN